LSMVFDGVSTSSAMGCGSSKGDDMRNANGGRSSRCAARFSASQTDRPAVGWARQGDAGQKKRKGRPGGGLLERSWKMTFRPGPPRVSPPVANRQRRGPRSRAPSSPK
jgi:hypothetical protein